MKTLTQICEDFKISKSTKIDEPIKVLLIETEDAVTCPFTISGNFFGLVYVANDNKFYHYIGGGTKREPWNLYEYVELITGINNWKDLGKYVYHNINNHFTAKYSTIGKKKLEEIIKQNHDIGITDASNTFIHDFINEMIDKGYLSRV